MLELHGISHAFGARAVLSRVSLTVPRGDRVGIVGPNGSGKSTLLRIAAGELRPDEGRVVTRASTRTASLAQSIEVPPGATVGTRFPVLAAGPGAAALGLDEVRGDTLLSKLSGGELVRLAIADAMAGRPDLLLLDEPTNHLDIAGMRWLEARLAAFNGAVIVVSHDPAFLDRVVDRLLVLGDHDAPAEEFAGTYSAWAEGRGRRIEEQRLAFGRQQRDEDRLREHISQIESRSRYIEQSTINFAIRKKAKKIARRSTTLKRRLERAAAATDRVARPELPPQPFLAPAPEVRRAVGRLADLDGVEVRAGGDGRVLLTGVSGSVAAGDRIALLGDNGTGKSTLLRLLGGGAPASGTLRLAQSTRVGVLAQDDAFPDRLALLPADVVRRETGLNEVAARNLVHRVVGAAAATLATLGQLSYGERRRLALALLVARGANLLLLDEPTNHLDVASREAIHAALTGYGGAIVFATHDRALIGSLATTVWSIEAGRVVPRTVSDAVGAPGAARRTAR